MSDMPRLGLQQEHEIPILLGLVVVGEEALLHICSILKVASDFILLLFLQSVVIKTDVQALVTHLLQGHAVLNQ